MPGGIHLLIGLLVIFIFNKLFKMSPGFKRDFLFGSILPDIDLPLVTLLILISIATYGYNEDNGRIIVENFHRSITHSLISVGIIYVVTRKAGLCFGMIFHSLTDIFYLSGVKILWPIYDEVVFMEVPLVGLYDFYAYSKPMQKLIMTLDVSTEALFYLGVIYFLIPMINQDDNKETNKKKEGITMEDPYLDFYWKLGWIQLIVIWVVYFGCEFFLNLTVEAYIGTMYSHGIIGTMINIMSPLYLQKFLLGRRTKVS